MQRSRTLSLTLLIIGVLVLGTMAPAPTLAQDTPESTPEGTPGLDTGPQFVLKPTNDVDGSYFTLEGEAGSSHTLSVTLGNSDTEPLALRTYAADAFTLVNGGFGVREESELREGVSTWIAYEPGTLEFRPGEGIERSFTVTIPDDAAPGQYIAGIVLQTAEPIAVEGSPMFNQIVRKSVAVFIIVPGEITPALELGSPEIQTNVAGQRVVVPMSNAGNVLLKPEGELLLTSPDGSIAFRQPFTMGSVYAGMDTTLEVPLPPALLDGDYTVTVRMQDEATALQAGIDETPVTLSREVAEEAPLEITAAGVVPMPSADDVQFAAVSVTVENRDLPVEGARVVLHVERDGEPVEDFVLASSVTLQRGETVIEQRYLPLEGWSEGEWTFSVTIESVDPQTSAEASLVTAPVDAPIVIDGES